MKRNTQFLFSVTYTLVVFSILVIFTSLEIQQYTIIIQSPTSEDFHYLQSLDVNKLSCACRTITISHRTFIDLQAEFHPVCSSEFVTRTWSDALFFENASLYLPTDVRSTLSAQYQLLSSLCSLAKRMLDDKLYIFLATQFIATEAVSNVSLHIQVRMSTFLVENRKLDFVFD